MEQLINKLSEEEKKAIHLLQSYAGMTHKLTDNQGRPKLDQAIEKAINLIEKQQEQLQEKDKIINMLKDEREYIKNNLKVDLNRKGVYAQAKGQIAQILDYYENNDEYFTKKAREM